jgi:AraC-like DNA-binding protein
MTEFDHVRFEQIGEAVFGNVQVPPREIKRGVRAMGLDFPFLMAATRAPKNKISISSGWQRDKYFWHLHAGLVYVLWPATAQSEPSFSRRGWLCGETVRCAKADNFITALQNAAVALRRKELKTIIRHAPPMLSFADELDWRRLALRRLREGTHGGSTPGTRHWRSALEVWLEIVLLRYQTHIHSVHRRLSEFLCLMTCDLAGENSVSNSLRRLQRGVFGLYSLDEVRHRFPTMIEELSQELPLHLSPPNELSPIAAQALAWLDEQFRRPATVAECAAAIPVSAPYLCRLLRHETGLSPVQHLQQRRVAHAKSLLQESSGTIATIAQRSGFGSAEHFHRVFRAQVGLSPAAYRRNAQKF